MAVSLVEKGIIGFVSISTVAAGTFYFVSDLLREKNPSKRLISFPISTEDQTGKDAWSRYRNSNKKANFWGVSGGSAI